MIGLETEVAELDELNDADDGDSNPQTDDTAEVGHQTRYLITYIILHCNSTIAYRVGCAFT
jgi:hypothetical protein